MAILKEYYKNLSEEGLMQDDFFVDSIKRPTLESEVFWKDFLQTYPQQQKTFETACSLITQLKFRPDLPQPGAKERLWETINLKAKQEAPVVTMHNRRHWIWAAAAITGIILISAIWLLTQQGSTTKINTQYSELKQFVLPDQSVVTLNANSSLEYKREWKNGQPREVWLKGEGFFEVKHLNKDGEPVKEADRFIVHTDEMSVEVLGTTFNVSDRQSISKVVLQTGKVRVDFRNQHTASVIMVPGELVKYDRQTKQAVKEKTNIDNQVSWKKKELVLNNTSVQDVISIIENNFGYKVEVENMKIFNEKLSGTGTVSLEDEKTLFKSLELILNVEITIKDKILHIKNK